MLLRLQNILSEPRYFQVSLEAKIVLRKVRRSALSDNTPICVLASRAEPQLTTTSLKKRYSRPQITRFGWKYISPDNRKPGQSANMKEITQM